MTILKEAVEQLPPNLQEEVSDFVEFLLRKQTPKSARRLQLDQEESLVEWRYALHIARVSEGYKATVLGDPAIKGSGATRAAAILQAEATLRQAVANEEIVTATVVVAARNPWREDAGMWKNVPDEEWAAYQQAIDDYRDELTKDEAVV